MKRILSPKSTWLAAFRCRSPICTRHFPIPLMEASIISASHLEIWPSIDMSVKVLQLLGMMEWLAFPISSKTHNHKSSRHTTCLQDTPQVVERCMQFHTQLHAVVPHSQARSQTQFVRPWKKQKIVIGLTSFTFTFTESVFSGPQQNFLGSA